MFNWLNKITNVKKDISIFDFREIPVTDIVNYPDGINDIYKRSIDGFLIKNVLSSEEVNLILRNHHRIFPENKTVINKGLSTYPKSFSQVDQVSKNSEARFEKYFSDCSIYWDTFEENYKFNFGKRMQDILGSMAGNRDVTPPSGFNEKGFYCFANFRELNPTGRGTLKAHCGNYFHKEFPQFFSHLDRSSHIENQLSYFVMLQDAEKGGELVLYNVEWSEAEIRLHGDTKLQAKNGKIYDLENPKQVKQSLIIPQPGDMIVFAGGQIWHKVNEVAGRRTRITLGGFLSLSHDDQKLFMWA